MQTSIQTARSAAMILSLAAVTTAHAEIAYGQTLADLNSTDFGWFSHSESRATRNFKHADNFQLSTSTQINQVNWWGMTEGNNSSGLENFDTFQIEFYTSRTTNNNRIKPDVLIASESFNISQTNIFDTGHHTANGAIKYSHQITLSSAVSFDASTTYWISISARSIDGSGDAWQWLDSDLFGGASSSWDYANNRWLALQDTDSAFQLVSVPAPASSLAMVLGLAATTRRRRG